jgi:cytochrome c oxidase subunit 3
MLIICYFRAKREHFSRRQHLGFEFSAWYWHFVDVVWIFLWMWIYLWGS